ncbi:MAG: 4Fe-4S binding protein [Chloroflexota bacterium]|nr:4Fe-4S binding protein [Chloroflexota bacterium]
MTLKSWKDIPIGGVIADAGNSEEYETGGWRSRRPVMDMEKCTHCMLCWVYCPDGSIMANDGKIEGIDLAHCKGCGICAHECPRGAITMVNEADVKEEV